jgi:hypothetical protein
LTSLGYQRYIWALIIKTTTMKKISLMLLAGTALIASCGQEQTTTTNTNNDAYIDSAVNSLVAIRTDEMYRSNDSLILAMATMRADSITAAKNGRTISGGGAVVRTTRTTVRTGTGTRTTTTTPKTVVNGGLGSQSDQARAKDKKTVEGGGLGSQSDKNKANDKSSVEGGGLGSQADRR